MTAEERGRAALLHIARNEQKLRRNLAKNIDYDPRYFDDAFQDTVVKVYEAITVHGVNIENLDNYFYTASRYNYINIRDKERKREQTEVKGTHCDVSDEPARDPDSAPMTMGELRRELSAQFGATEADVFIGYSAFKRKGNASYRKYSRKVGLSTSAVTSIVRRIKKSIRDGVFEKTRKERQQAEGEPQEGGSAGSLRQPDVGEAARLETKVGTAL